MEHISEAPKLQDFTALSEHQEQTPGSFFGGKPVLHLHAPAATVKVPVQQYEAQADLRQLVGSTAPVPSDGNLNIEGVDVWVTSRHLLLYTPAASSGLQVSYQAITITAQDGADVLLELNLSHADTADEDIQYVQLRLFATRIEHHATTTAETETQSGANGTTSHNDTATALWKAISDCQELNPDPVANGEEGEDGEMEFDETAPGATGWITSENMADFMDENGNFRMPAGMAVIGGEEEQQEPLGEGAGRSRTAAELDAEEGADGDDAKWQRTG
ncbi:hypothetical protein AC578_6940 [Pseudocercospora eumusae]|uniref:Regulator of volume decrease after cellular swelling-domain-containing protein n=1 Tax=Pseudocercospora eumusae TaxID=321146 RepID=A0A139H9J7_9PEZI|nr:hypothetical protein AC578_6940 [Pseudocercospora eumusae]